VTKTASKTPSTATPAEIANDPRLAVEKFNGAELRFARLYREQAGVLAEVRAKRGRAVLEADEPRAVAGQVNTQIRTLEDELGALSEAASEARRLRLQAIPKIFAADAAEAEREATELDRQAATLAFESARLRKVLSDHDGCSYSPTSPPTRDLSGPRVEGGGAPIYYVQVPKFERLRLAANGKREEAVRHRQRKPLASGSVNAGDIETLLAAIFSDALRIGPPVDAIYAWAAGAIEQQRRRRTASGEDLVPVALHLVWNHGVIEAQSRVESSEVSVVSTAFDSSEVERFEEPEDTAQLASA
jgi:hypothetical protein